MEGPCTRDGLHVEMAVERDGGFVGGLRPYAHASRLAMKSRERSATRSRPTPRPCAFGETAMRSISGSIASQQALIKADNFAIDRCNQRQVRTAIGVVARPGGLVVVGEIARHAQIRVKAIIAERFPCNHRRRFSSSGCPDSDTARDIRFWSDFALKRYQCFDLLEAIPISICARSSAFASILQLTSFGACDAIASKCPRGLPLPARADQAGKPESRKSRSRTAARQGRPPRHASW